MISSIHFFDFSCMFRRELLGGWCMRLKWAAFTCDLHNCSDHEQGTLPWRRRPCRPQPAQRSELCSRSLLPSWRSAESDSSPALWGPPGVTGQTQSHEVGSFPFHCKPPPQKTNTSNSWLAMLKWDDFTMSQASRLFSTVPESMQEECVE